jgi:hypothetical protein
MLDYIRDCGSEVLFFEQPPEVEVGDYSVPLFVAYQTSELTDLNSQTLIHAHRPEEVKQGNQRVKKLSEANAWVHYLSLYDLFVNEERKVLVRDQGEIFFLDEDHISYSGALRGKELIKSAIVDLVK